MVNIWNTSCLLYCLYVRPTVLNCHSLTVLFVFCVHLYLLFQLLCVDSYLLVDELISPKDIDPIHRYVPHQDQRNVSMRYSNQVSCLLMASHHTLTMALQRRSLVLIRPQMSSEQVSGILLCCKEEGQIIRINTFSRAAWQLKVPYFTSQLVWKWKSVNTVIHKYTLGWEWFDSHICNILLHHIFTFPADVVVAVVTVLFEKLHQELLGWGQHTWCCKINLHRPKMRFRNAVREDMN